MGGLNQEDVMKDVWCARHRDGWCAVKPNKKFDEGATSVPTKCGHFVILPGGMDKRQPTCDECRKSK
jgi:hypothetical protein